MARWRPVLVRHEAPEWYRNFHPEDWDEPDDHERGMIEGCSGHRCWPDSPGSAWPDWPEWLHQQHGRRRWEEAKHAYRQEQPGFAAQEFGELVASRRKRTAVQP